MLIACFLSQVEEYFSMLPEIAVPRLGTSGERHRDRQLAIQLPKQDLARAYCRHLDLKHASSADDFMAARNEIALDIGSVQEILERDLVGIRCGSAVYENLDVDIACDSRTCAIHNGTITDIKNVKCKTEHSFDSVNLFNMESISLYRSHGDILDRPRDRGIPGSKRIRRSQISDSRFCPAGVRRVRIVPQVRQPRCVSQQAGSLVSPGVLQMCRLQGAPGRSRLLRARRDAFLREALRGTAQAAVRRVRRGKRDMELLSVT